MRGDGYPGSTINKQDNKLAASGYAASRRPGCLVCTYLTQGSSFMQDAGDFTRTDNRDKVVRPSRLLSFCWDKSGWT